MTHLCFLALTFLSSPVLAASAASAGPIVSVENATFHQLVFANEDVAILNNLYPAHSDSGFHLHPRELFYVVVAAAKASTQKPGQPLQTPDMAPTGSVGFNVMTSEPFVHRVVNGDRRPYHVIAVEIRRPAPLGAPLSARDQSAGYQQIFDNNRLRAWRIILAPGQATLALTQAANGVRVVVRGGLLLTSHAGIPDQTLALENADFAFQSAGSTRTLRNVGKTTIELVELELK
jgi:hypothetical protein